MVQHARSDCSCELCEPKPSVDSPVSVDAVVVDSTEKIVYLRAVMTRERNGNEITIKEEMVLKDDRPMHHKRSCTSESGEEIVHATNLAA